LPLVGILLQFEDDDDNDSVCSGDGEFLCEFLFPLPCGTLASLGLPLGLAGDGLFVPFLLTDLINCLPIGLGGNFDR
jgi:hypothetical protein